MLTWTIFRSFVGLLDIILANIPIGQDEHVGQRIFRLVDSEHRHEGRVEVFHNGRWGTICSRFQPFGVSESNLVCRSIGYSNGGTPRSPRYKARYGYGRGKIWLRDLDCPWGATHLNDCLHKPWGNTPKCTHADDVWVVCNMRPVQALRVRLVGGSSPNEGRLQVLRNGEWGTMCNLGHQTAWDPRDAAVICRQLGYNHGGEALMWNINNFGRIDHDTPVWISPFQCGGKEPNLGHCPNLNLRNAPSVCSRPRASIALRCYSQSLRDFRVRIDTGGRNGSVNIYHHGRWYNICDDWWGDDDARVVCQTLGYSDGRATHVQLNSTEHGFGWDMVYCPHRTQDFSACYHRGWGLHTCHWYEMAGVECF